MSQQQCYFCFQPWLSMWKFLLNSGIILTRWSHETYRFCEFNRQKCVPEFITWWRMSSQKYITSPRFSCPVSSLSIMSFPICCWRCRDAVGIERQSDSLFCAGPFESTPPLLINCAAVCKSEKGLPQRNYLFIFKQSSYQCDGRKNGSSSGKLNFEGMVLWRTGHIWPE